MKNKKLLAGGLVLVLAIVIGGLAFSNQGDELQGASRNLVKGKRTFTQSTPTNTNRKPIPTNKPVNEAPKVSAGQDQTVEDSDGNGTETVIVKGVVKDDGKIASYSWQEGSQVLSNLQNDALDLSVGTHTLTLVVTDDKGATGKDSVQITVEAEPLFPDLVVNITGYEYDFSSPSASSGGEYIRMDYEISNIGDADAPGNIHSKLSMIYAGAPWQSKTSGTLSSGLAVGESLPYSIYFNPDESWFNLASGTGAQFSATANVDYDYRYVEKDETNNKDSLVETIIQ